MRTPRATISRYTPHRAEDADESELLADDGGDEVGVRLGQVEDLQALAEAEPRHVSPEPKLITDWNGW